ncbi:hypothetical protein BH11PLA1_BH11PLA1_07000 [soil metagenome]
MYKTMNCLLAVLVAAGTAQAQLSFTGTNLTENFDGMPSTGTTALNGTTGTQTNITGATGWQATRVAGTGTTLSLIADNGSSTTGAVFSYGAAGTTERALGSLASGANAPGFGVSITNNASAAIDTVTLSFSREQWRSSTTTANTLTFAYAVSGGTATNANFITDASAILNPLGDLVGGAAVAANGALDGNANSIAVSFTFSVSVGVGQTLFLRWQDFNDLGSDAGLAIDNFTFAATTVPTPGAAGLLGLGGLLISRRRR